MPYKNAVIIRKIFIASCMLFASWTAIAQELFVSTEPASNIASGMSGFRLNTKFFHMASDGSYTYRINPELIFGIGKEWMLRLNFYGSDIYQPGFKMEGGSAYVKYRFYNSDDIHSHLRLAAFGRMSIIDNPAVIQTHYTYYMTGSNGQMEEHDGLRPYPSDEIDLEGNNSGFLAGMVATKLVRKMAISSSAYIINRWDNLQSPKSPLQSNLAVNYTLSAGYLLFPRVYKNFSQTNLNLYCELLGSSSLDKKAYFIDIAPAIQFIFNSISRLDLSYRTQITGDMNRLSKNYFLVRFEFDLQNNHSRR